MNKFDLFTKRFDENFQELLDVLKSDKAWRCHENIDTLDFNNVSTVVAQRGSGANMISVWNRGSDNANKRWGEDFGVRIGTNLYDIPTVQTLFSNAREFNYRGKKEYRISVTSLHDALELAYRVAIYEATYKANNTKEVTQEEVITA